MSVVNTSHLPFIDAIIADPADDLPRLVFADWLDERGDPRGEFIRVQCELAKLPATVYTLIDVTDSHLPDDLASPADRKGAAAVIRGTADFDLGKPIAISVGKLYAGPFIVRSTRAITSHYAIGTTDVFTQLDLVSVGRVQRLPSADWMQDKREELRRREKEMLDLHSVQWFQELQWHDDWKCMGVVSNPDGSRNHGGWFCQQPIGVPDNYILGDFERGFVGSIICTADDLIGNMDEIVKASPLHEVTLTTMPPRDFLQGICDGIAFNLIAGHSTSEIEAILRHRWPSVKTWLLPRPPQAEFVGPDTNLVALQERLLESVTAHFGVPRDVLTGMFDDQAY